MVRPLKLSVGRQFVFSSNSSASGALTRQARSQFQVIEDNYAKFVQHMGNEAPQILKEAMEPTFDKSKEYCPKDSGTLVNSGFMEVESFRGGARLELGYAKNNKPSYAIYVHEMPYAHDAPTRSKWLQAAVDEDRNDIEARFIQLTKIASGV